MTQSTAPLQPIVMEKTIAASPEQVFKAWTNPDQITQWFRCGSTRMIKADIDLRIGGSYQFEMFNDEENKSACLVNGIYTEIEQNKKLVFTWSNDVHAVKNTVVTVLLEPLENATKIKLSHSGFMEDEQRDDHSMGWTGVTESLVTYFQKK